MTTFDLALFEQLNDEYQTHPVVDVEQILRRRALLSPTEHDVGQASYEERIAAAVKRQLEPVKRDLEIADRRVLELGCGSGFQSRALLDVGQAKSVIAIDVERRSTWDELADDRLAFVHGDLAKTALVEPASIDLVVSHVVFEHVRRPLQMLAAVRDVLVDGGAAWLRMNVYTASNASHRYSEVFFPWPHLLFDDEVVRQFYELHHGQTTTTIEWVNRMTVAHYLHVCRSLGFEIAAVRRRVAPIDIPFYLRFQGTLGRYAALDLETSFLTLVLYKRPQTELTETSVASIDYLACEQSLEKKITAHQRERRRARQQAASLADTPAS